MLLAVSGNVFSTFKPFHICIHLFIIMSTVCIILLWGRSWWRFDQSGNVSTWGRFDLGTFWL